MLVEFAYQPGDGTLLHYRLIGGPNWIDIDRFDVLAKLDGDARSMPHEQIQQMAQSLLEDRFQLHVHREVRDLPLYNLVVAKSGLKMKLSDSQTPPNPPGGIRFDTFDRRAAARMDEGRDECFDNRRDW